MTSIIEILGGAQRLLALDFDIQDCFEQILTSEQRTFLALLKLVFDAFPVDDRAFSRRGRPRFRLDCFQKSFLAKSFFAIDTMAGLRSRLLSDANLRRICGFVTVPSLPTFSRRMAKLASDATMERVLNDLVRAYLSDRIVGHISRDSTAIEARERPVNRKSSVDTGFKEKRKRGRPRKGESRPEKKKRRLQRQLSMKPGKALAELESSCTWGCKKNSQGNVSFWKGYKLHLDVTDLGIPVTAVVTGACVHDSQTAIPMAKLTERKVTSLYSVMDSAYDAPEVRLYERGKGRVPLIDHNDRRGMDRAPFDQAEKERFKIRSTVERANAHLKDYLLPARLYVRGAKKVTFQLMCGVVCLAALKILQYFILPSLAAKSA